MCRVEASEFTTPLLPALALVLSLYAQCKGVTLQSRASRRNVATAFESQQFPVLSEIIDPLFCRLAILGVEANGFGLNIFL
jgi:hypothetical protein